MQKKSIFIVRGYYQVEPVEVSYVDGEIVGFNDSASGDAAVDQTRG